MSYKKTCWKIAVRRILSKQPLRKVLVKRKTKKKKMKIYKIFIAYPNNNIFYEDGFIKAIKAESRKKAKEKARKKWGEYVS